MVLKLQFYVKIETNSWVFPMAIAIRKIEEKSLTILQPSRAIKLPTKKLEK
jgi:hypothetical protein